MALTAALFTLTSCSNEELAGSPLPEGAYPLQLTATVDGMQSRTAGKDSWKQGDQIGVKLNNKTSTYTLNADGTVLETKDPLYWQDSKTDIVSAWYPAELLNNSVDISDQSSGFASFDYLFARASGSFKAPVAFVFKHCMAKVKCRLKAGDGITDADLTSATVCVSGYTKVLFASVTGVCDGDGAEGWITTTSDHDALLVPHDMGGKEFIRVDIGGNTFTYTAPSGTANLQAGNAYTYNITVKANGIEVEEATSGEWTNGGSEDVKSFLSYSSTETKPKMGDYVYADGTWSDGGLRRLYNDGGMSYVSVSPQSGKTCVGIVFHVRNGSSPADDSQYTEFSNNAPTGYIVSLDQNTSCWASGWTYGDDQTPVTAINGYKYTKEYYDKYNNTVDLIAVKWCKNHSKPANSGGCVYSSWYMPSQMEYKLMRSYIAGGANISVLNLLKQNIKNASGDAIRENSSYYTVGLMGTYGNYLHLYNITAGTIHDGDNDMAWSSYPYRAMCAYRMN